MLSPQFVHMIVCLSITSIAQIGMNGFQSKFVGSWAMVKQRNDSILEVIWPSCHATCAIFSLFLSMKPYKTMKMQNSK